MTSLFIFDPSYIRRTSQRIDYWGMGMLAVGIAALQIMLDKGTGAGLVFVRAGSPACWWSAIVFSRRSSCANCAADIPWCRLRVFKERTYSTGVFLMTVLGFVLYGSLVLLPIWLQTLLGYPAVQAGIAMAPRGLGSFIGMPVMGRVHAQVRSAKVSGRRSGGGRWHALSAFAAEPGCGLLGFLLAAVHPGIRLGACYSCR